MPICQSGLVRNALLLRKSGPFLQVKLPSIDKDALFREIRTAFTPDVAKAVVDDCYLGHIDFNDLNNLLDEFSSGRSESGNEETTTAAFRALLAECFACRRADIVDLAVEYLEVAVSPWR